MQNTPQDPASLSRRDFLRKSGLGALGLGLGLGSLRPVHGLVRTQATPKIAHIALGRTGLKVSRIAVGGGSVTLACVEAAVDQGINLLHTAPGYGRGETARTYARVFQGGKRDKVVLAYKGIVEKHGGKPESLDAQVDEALRP